MPTSKNKVEEWTYHPNPQNKFTISIVQAKLSLGCCAFFVASVRHMLWWSCLCLLPLQGNQFQIFFRAGKMHVFFANPKPLVLIPDRFTADLADPLGHAPVSLKFRSRTSTSGQKL